MKFDASVSVLLLLPTVVLAIALHLCTQTTLNECCQLMHALHINCADNLHLSNGLVTATQAIFGIECIMQRSTEPIPDVYLDAFVSAPVLLPPVVVTSHSDYPAPVCPDCSYSVLSEALLVLLLPAEWCWIARQCWTLILWQANLE